MSEDFPPFYVIRCLARTRDWYFAVSPVNKALRVTMKHTEMVHSVLTVLLVPICLQLYVYMYHEPASGSWPQSCRGLARQYPILGLPCFSGMYCSSVSFGRRVLDGPPWRWFPRPHRSWLVPWWATRQPILTFERKYGHEREHTNTLELSRTAAAVPYIPSIPAGSDATCLQPGQHS